MIMFLSQPISSNVFRRVSNLFCRLLAIFMLATFSMFLFKYFHHDNGKFPQNDDFLFQISLAIALVLGCVAIVAGQFVFVAQQRENRIAAKSDKRGYFVYLRSFDRRPLELVSHSGGPANPSPDAFIVHDALDELANAVSKIGTLFVIGRTDGGSADGSPSFISINGNEGTWRPLFNRLIDGARAIFFMPGVSSGILEELDVLRINNQFHKVVVIMPPNTGRDGREHKWNAISNKLARLGYQLPRFEKSGLLYLAGNDLTPFRSVHYSHAGERRLEHALADLMADLPPKEATSDVISDIEAIERSVPISNRERLRTFWVRLFR